MKIVDSLKKNFTDAGLLITIAVVAVLAVWGYNSVLRPNAPDSLKDKLPPA